MATAAECRERGKHFHLRGQWDEARVWFLRGACQHHCLECRVNLVRAGCWAGVRLAADADEATGADEAAQASERRIQERAQNYVRLVQLSAHHPIYTYNLACYYARMGDASNARQWFRITAATLGKLPAPALVKRHRRLMLKTMHRQIAKAEAAAALAQATREAQRKLEQRVDSCVLM
jgi:hypothetical protein